MSEKPRVKDIAHLARLDLTDMDVDRLEDEFGRILAYLDQLEEVADDAAEPRFHAVAEIAPETPLRDDEQRASLPADEAVEQSPGEPDESNLFRVPRVIE